MLLFPENRPSVTNGGKLTVLKSDEPSSVTSFKLPLSGFGHVNVNSHSVILSMAVGFGFCKVICIVFPVVTMPPTVTNEHIAPVGTIDGSSVMAEGLLLGTSLGLDVVGVELGNDDGN